MAPAGPARIRHRHRRPPLQRTRLSDTSLAASRAALAAPARHARAGARRSTAERLAGQDRLSLDLFIARKGTSCCKQLAFYPYELQPSRHQDGLHIRFAADGRADAVRDRERLPQLPGAPGRAAGPCRRPDRADARRDAHRLGRRPRRPCAACPACCARCARSLDERRAGRAVPPASRPRSTSRCARSWPPPARPRCATRSRPRCRSWKTFMPHRIPAGRARHASPPSRLPGGADYYALLVAQHTGSAHDAGRSACARPAEVARIRAADARRHRAHRLQRARSRQFSAFANSDTRLFYNDAGQAAGALPPHCGARQCAACRSLFASAARRGPGGQAGARRRRRRGRRRLLRGRQRRAARPALVVNTARLDARPLWEIETLALHEGVPGHHLQVARAHELAGLPAFRRHALVSGLRRRLGAVRRNAGPRTGLLQGCVFRLRPPELRTAARGAAGGRHRHPRAWAGRASRRSTT